VHVFGSGNVLAALCAVKWYGRVRHGDETADVVVLIHNPGLSDAVAHESAVVVGKMTSTHGWPKPIVLTRDEMNEITEGRSRKDQHHTLQCLRARLGRDRFDEIYYPHDLVGCAAELATFAYPNATPITFGDTLGNVTTRRHQFGLLDPTREGRSLVQKLRSVKALRAVPRGIRALYGIGRGAEAPGIHAREAVLILPIDESGDGLLGTDLLTVPKDFAQGILARCQQAVPELAAYSRGLLAKTLAPHYLMLLENWTDGDFTSFEHEVAMYEEMVERHVSQGATVFIKGHPLSAKPLDEELRRRLSSRFSPSVVSREFGLYPVELWGDLIASCEVVSMGYPGTSLAFFHNKQVIYPFSLDMVERFFPKRMWVYLQYCDLIARAQRARLTSWDGRGIFLQGPI
jgi:hypothetical protein